MATSKSTTRTNLKRCSRCGFTCDYAVAAQFFSRDSMRRDGLQFPCKKCQSDYRNEHHEDKLAYDAAHREKNRVRAAIYATEHREERAAYRAAHRKERCAREAIYRSTHREEQRARHAAYYASPRGKELYRIYRHNRRALEKSQGDIITKAEYDAVLAAHKNKKGQIICAWCGKPIEGTWHYDHWIPLAEGGRHEAGNLRVMHGKTGNKCNLKKGATMPFKFGKLI
jgi:HNH endonuclease